MATINIISNFDQVATSIAVSLEKIQDPEYLLRPVAQEQIRLMHDRIHEQGEASDGSQIGTYNSTYLKERQRKYNRTADTKVVVSLTRQLENDYAVIATRAGYGVGFNNPFNMQKVRWVEEIKGKPIGDATQEELNEAISFINELTVDALST
jgi:hypothetical protein